MQLKKLNKRVYFFDKVTELLEQKKKDKVLREARSFDLSSPSKTIEKGSKILLEHEIDHKLLKHSAYLYFEILLPQRGGDYFITLTPKVKLFSGKEFLGTDDLEPIEIRCTKQVGEIKKVFIRLYKFKNNLFKGKEIKKGDLFRVSISRGIVDNIKNSIKIGNFKIVYGNIISIM